MPLVSTPAIVLSAIRYSETSKIVRLATRDHGVQSVIAKGALRPKSRFGAALQLLSEGVAHFILSERKDLHTLTAFDLVHLRVGLASDLERYSAAMVLSEVMIRFASTEAHPASYDLLREALALLEAAPADMIGTVALGTIWRLVGELGFTPALDQCVRDGAPVSSEGALPFSPDEGGALCERCAVGREGTRLPAESRADLLALIENERDLPLLDERHIAAHRRLLTRYIRFHLAEGAELPALEFWNSRPWIAA
ncbi:MAG: DNA repair protein RecO [Gemmatimonadota bacterium]